MRQCNPKPLTITTAPQVAYCHYLKGEYMACRSLIASALNLCNAGGGSEGEEGESRVRGGLSMGEMRIVLLTHAVESELKMGVYS